MQLSVLIPTLYDRKLLFDKLVAELERQRKPYNYQVEILSYADDGKLSIGYKRNWLLKQAIGRYVCFIDDDDWISKNYIKLLMKGIEKDVDCCSLVGEITIDGKNPKLFIHFKDCIHYCETESAYHRYPNHLNCIKASIAKKFKFKEISYGEDTDWATQINNSGLIKTEYFIKDVIYYYRYNSLKK